MTVNDIRKFTKYMKENCPQPEYIEIPLEDYIKLHVIAEMLEPPEKSNLENN